MTFDNLAMLRPFLYPAQLGISTLSNVLVTTAIGIRAWYEPTTPCSRMCIHEYLSLRRHHRELAQNLRRSSTSPVSVLVILVEAGALLCFTQVRKRIPFLNRE